MFNREKIRQLELELKEEKNFSAEVSQSRDFWRKKYEESFEEFEKNKAVKDLRFNNDSLKRKLDVMRAELNGIYATLKLLKGKDERHDQ